MQLSGDEPWDMCDEALAAGPEGGEGEGRHVGRGDHRSPAAGRHPLLDTHAEGALGGTGRPFDWAVAAEVARRFPIVLAGGLTPENVGEAVRRVRPWAVDVSSGVETDGVKDVAKICAFIAALPRRRAQSRHASHGRRAKQDSDN